MKSEAEELGAPFLGELPLSLDVRLAGDAGAPAVLAGGAVGDAYAAVAKNLVERGLA